MGNENLIKLFFLYVKKLLLIFVMGFVFALLDITGLIQTLFPKVQITRDNFLWLFIVAFLISNFILFVQNYRNKENPELEADRKTFQMFMEFLPSDGAIKYIREFDYLGIINFEYLDPLYVFMNKSVLPDFEFYNNELEIKKQELKDLLSELTDLIATNFFTLDHIPNARQGRIPKDWYYKFPDRVEEINIKAKSLASQAWDLYTEIVRIGKRL